MTEGDVVDEANSVGARRLAERLRVLGVITVAGPELTRARPTGTDLVAVLGVLAGELAREWRTVADALPVLDGDRLQLQSAAGLLGRADSGAPSPERGSVAAEPVVARAVALYDAVRAPDDGRTLDEGTDLLDRTWGVLHDIRSYAAPDAPAADTVAGLVPSSVTAPSVDLTGLPARLDAAAVTGALVGRLGAWLPASRQEVLPRIEELMALVALLARSPQDEPWWYAMTTLGRNAAAVSVAAAFADAASRGPSPRQLSLLLTDQVMGGLLGQATAAARRFTLEHEVPPAVEGGRGPQASPAQQARAAAERAAAEREETQRAFMERNAARVARGATPPLGISRPEGPQRTVLAEAEAGLVEALPKQPLAPRVRQPVQIPAQGGRAEVVPDDVVDLDAPSPSAASSGSVASGSAMPVAEPEVGSEAANAVDAHRPGAGEQPAAATPMPGSPRPARGGGRGKGRRVPTPTDGVRAQVPAVTPTPLSTEGTGSSVWQTLMRPR